MHPANQSQSPESSVLQRLLATWCPPSRRRIRLTGFDIPVENLEQRNLLSSAGWGMHFADDAFDSDDSDDEYDVEDVEDAETSVANGNSAGTMSASLSPMHASEQPEYEQPEYEQPEYEQPEYEKADTGLLLSSPDTGSQPEVDQPVFEPTHTAMPNSFDHVDSESAEEVDFEPTEFEMAPPMQSEVELPTHDPLDDQFADFQPHDELLEANEVDETVHFDSPTEPATVLEDVSADAGPLTTAAVDSPSTSSNRGVGMNIDAGPEDAAKAIEGNSPVRFSDHADNQHGTAESEPSSMDDALSATLEDAASDGNEADPILDAPSVTPPSEASSNAAEAKTTQDTSTDNDAANVFHLPRAAQESQSAEASSDAGQPTAFANRSASADETRNVSTTDAADPASVADAEQAGAQRDTRNDAVAVGDNGSKSKNSHANAAENGQTGDPTAADEEVTDDGEALSMEQLASAKERTLPVSDVDRFFAEIVAAEPADHVHALELEYGFGTLQDAHDVQMAAVLPTDLASSGKDGFTRLGAAIILGTLGGTWFFRSPGRRKAVARFAERLRRVFGRPLQSSVSGRGE